MVEVEDKTDIGRKSMMELFPLLPVEGGSPGESTDIYVNGFIPSNKEYINVIIEVKGCWHNEVETAMSDQLLNRYLNESGCNRCIYIVGWYSCNQ
jgi:hypothetical protein